MAGFYSARGRIIPPLPWPTFAPPLSYVATEVLLILRRSETARTEKPCSCVSRSIDRMSFTVVRLACFRLGMAPLNPMMRGQSARTALAKIDLKSTSETVPQLAESLSRIY